MSYTPFTQGLRPLCLPCATTKLTRSPSKTQRRRKYCLGRSRVAQSTFRPRHGRYGRREVLSIFKQSHKGRRGGWALTSRSRAAGRRHTLPWSQNGCTGVGHWWHRKLLRTVVNIIYQFERCFCILCIVSVPPLADQ